MKFDLEPIIDLVPGNIYWKDKSGVYLGCNENQAKILNLKSRHDIVGLTLHDLLPAEMAKIVEKNDQYVMEKGVEFVVDEQGFDTFGNAATYLSRKIPLFDPEGNVIGLLGLSVINKRTFDLEKIIAMMPGNVFWKDSAGRFLGCNDNHAKLYNLASCRDIVGLTNMDLVDEEIATQCFENDLAVMRSGKEYVFEENGLDKDCNPAVYLTRKVPIIDEKQKVTGLLGISMDITLRKKYEEELRSLKEKAEAANKAKSDFIMNMSHDLRTPMTGIIGFTDILKFKETDPEKKEMLELLETSANRLLNLMNEIVTSVEIEEKHAVDIETFSLRNLIDDTFLLLRPAIEYKKLNYMIEIDEALPYSFAGDRKRLAQILLNLAGNAVKFTEHGHVKITVKNLSSIVDGNIKIQLSVHDTGIGIDNKYFKDIFEKFSHLNYRNKEKYPGAGLGLWLVKTFVDDMGGKIDVKSKLGVGTTFILELSFHVV